MGWKDWSYTLKGAVLFVIIGLVIIIGFFSYLFISESLIENSPPGDFDFKEILNTMPYVLAMVIFPSAVVLFIIGAIIGRIYGKIRRSKNGRN